MIRASKSSPAQPRRNNSSRGDRVKKEIQLEIAHVLFISFAIVGYSKLAINEQRALIDMLNQIDRQNQLY